MSLKEVQLQKHDCHHYAEITILDNNKTHVSRKSVESMQCMAPAPSLNIEVKIFNFSATMYEDEQCMANNKYALYLLF